MTEAWEPLDFGPCKHPAEALVIDLSAPPFDVIHERCTACGMLLLSASIPHDEAEWIRADQFEDRMREVRKREALGRQG